MAASELRHGDLDHEPSARLQVRGRVAEAGHLSRLRVARFMIVLNTRYTRRYRPGTRVCAKSPMVTPTGPAHGLGVQPGHHRPGQVDPVHLDPALGQRQGDPPRPDAELEGGTTGGQPGQQEHR